MKNPLPDSSRLSHGQQALWYLNQVEPASTAYHLGVCLRLTGLLDERALASAWTDMGMAHPQLRARFTLRDGWPAIGIDPVPAALRVETGGAENLERFWKEIAGRPFDLQNETPARALLLRTANGPSHLLLCMHHIVGDLWSSAIMLRELSASYQAHASGCAPVVLREGMEYAAFTEAEDRWLEEPAGIAAWEFWREHLEGVNTQPILTRGVANEKSGEVPVALGAAASALVQSAAREQKTTPYAVLLACYARLLGEETGRDELIIGTPATIRDHAALRNTVGYLVNAVPVRCPVTAGGSDSVSAVTANARRALAHRRFPFPLLVERLLAPRAPGLTPLFQSMFAYQSLPRRDRSLLPLALNTQGVQWEFGGGIKAETVAMPPFDAQFPVALTLGSNGETFSGRLQYDGRRVTADDATRLAGRLPELISEFLTRRKPKPPETTIHRPAERLEHLFDAAARRTPDAVAASERELNLTYSQVKARAETLAAGLDAALSERDGPVALQMPSGAEAVILILAILKSGRAFQPIDPGEPPARRNAMLLHTGACALLSPTEIAPGILPDGVASLSPEKLNAFPPATIRARNASPTAYLVFTSGSTGEPKAVEVEHAAVINHARAMSRLFGLTPSDHVLQFHTLAFDAAFEEIFPSWNSGARIVFEPQARELSIPALFELVANNKVTVLNLPTSYWHTLTSEAVRLKWRPPSHLRLLVVGGERASEKVYSVWRKLAPHCRWINTYGPTEATITALTYEPPPGNSVHGNLPIGRPIDGVTALILNDASEQLSEGELFLGGKGLAVGYRGDPETTAAKFVTRTIAGKTWRLYRTGDRAKLRPDGNVEYLGRLDRQLKIRGYRIDPGEIERALLAHPAIADAVVMPQEFAGELTLAAWIKRVNGSPSARELRAHLAGQFPAHLIPSRLNFVTRLPRKPSGKLDATALIQPRRRPANRGNPDAQAMTDLFSKLLGHEVSPQDDFFLSGGHSLLAIKLLGQVEARFGARLSVSDFIATPTANGLWARLPASPRADTDAVPETAPDETPVSAQQHRALLAHEIGRPALANIVLLLRVEGRLDEHALERAVEAVARRHPLLRCGFLRTNAGVVLRETAKLPKLERRILRHRDFKNALANLVRQEGTKPFALDGRAPWFRLLLVSAPGAKKRHLILITHHAVADGWAFDLLLDDLRAGYDQAHNGGELLKPSRDYRTYALRQGRWLESPAAREQASFWKQRLSGAEQPRLPFRRATSPDTSWRIEHHELDLSAKLSRNLREVAAAYGITIYALTMACFKALIHRYAGQSDIVLGTVVSNRSTEADQGVFGPLQNPALIRDEVVSSLPIRELARKVARSLAEAQDHGTLPFERVIREALPHHSAVLDGDIQFLSRDHIARELRLGGASVHLVETPLAESPFELSVAVSSAAPRIQIVFEYQPTAYPALGIEQLAQQYAALLQSVAATPDAKVRELNLTPAEELRSLARRVSAVRRPRAELLHQGFENQVGRNPNAPAIAARERRLTYGELNSLAKPLADALTGGGLKPGGLVAVMLPKGWEQIVACLAVLKAGGAYVPVDPALPAARLKSIFDQGAFQTAIVTDLILQGEPWAQRLSSMVTILSQTEAAPALRRARVKPGSLAYVIFTSGSTGVPKGVMIPHQAAMTTIAEINRRFQIQPSDRVFAVSALGFDLSVFDIFGMLRAGGTIVVPANHDPKEWRGQILTEGVTVWNSVPCLFELLLDEAAERGGGLETLRLILLSGDFISPALARRAQTMLPQARLVSLGGATEGAIWSIAHEIEEADFAGRGVPYGRALRGQEVFVLDAMLDHCATGVTGELFIAGAGLAEGYWRNRRETKRRFRLHPRWNIRLYHTGDQGRYLENGEIKILGRLDDQVKVNGVRLELGEVESALCSLPSVRHALAEVRMDAAGDKRLIAFVAAEPGANASTLSAHAQKLLPAVLRPAAYVVLDQLPLTANGKVDRAALRTMALPLPEKSVAPPERPSEKWIAELWSTLLDGVTVGVEDNFFALGGHSLLAIKMLQRVRSHFAVDLPLSLIVGQPTVRGLAAAVNAATAGTPQAGLPRRATAELEGDSEPVMSKPSRRNTNLEPDAVLLTGATGHLGLALLVELLQQTNDRIYCLVRANSQSEAEARLLKVLMPHNFTTIPKDRITAIPADLSQTQFGLTPAAFTVLAAKVRAIYHCAAEVNFIAPYEKLAASNVGGVREIIHLATAGGAVLHHVSSVAVFPYGGGRILSEDEDITRIKTLTGGYAQSKWVSERMVWKAMAQGLRAVIYRPAQIVGRKTDGPQHDLFDHILRVCQTLGTVPDLEARIDMVTSEYAAAAIRSLSTQESSLGKAFHLVHPDPVALRDFIALLPMPPRVVPLKKWLALLNAEVEASNDPSLHFVSLLVQGLGRADLTPPDFDCRNTIAGLRGTGIVCPPLDREFLHHELALSEATP